MAWLHNGRKYWRHNGKLYSCKFKFKNGITKRYNVSIEYYDKSIRKEFTNFYEFNNKNQAIEKIENLNKKYNNNRYKVTFLIGTDEVNNVLI